MSLSSSAVDRGQDTVGSYPSISIVGAGVAGLSLACHLRRRRIPFAIFDAAPKAKGHNYGITISSWGYGDLLQAIEPKLTDQAFREITAVDRLTRGSGVTTSAEKNGDHFRASDMALREVLARGHQINWNHKVVSAQQTSIGTRLGFENGQTSTTDLVIDAGGERSGLTCLLLPDLKPDILPYAVYHGSRYIPLTTFTKVHGDIFPNDDNVRSFPPPTASSTAWHLQLAKSYITQPQVPSAITLDPVNRDDPIVELRYTFSRPALPGSDPLYNPTRAPAAAKTTPPAFFDELSTYLSHSNASTSPLLPPSLPALLSPAAITSSHDRVLNWLLRVKPLARAGGSGVQSWRALASAAAVCVGDAVHSTPPVASEGASLAMADAGRVAGWIEETFGRGNGVFVSEEIVRTFYEERLPAWADALDRAEERLREMHRQDRGETEKLSGRI